MSCRSLPCPLHPTEAAVATATPPPGRWCRLAFLAASIVVLLSSSPARAGFIITGGSAAITLTEGKAAAISTFNAYFDALATRTQILTDPAPGNAPWTSSGNIVTLTDDIRPYGVTPTPYPGTPGVTRSPQETTLEIENTSDVLGSWTQSNNAFGFVGNSTLGEQIAFTHMQRWTGPFTGSLLYGDFALRYTGSKLVLTSNIDFLNAAFADLGDAKISVQGDILTISGNLLIGGGLTVLDPGAVAGTNFGTITITATLRDTNAAIPEPSSAVLLALGGVGVSAIVRRRPGRQRGD
ncbi:PEP-CTERM sorting domain-containing protein [Aquisphaera insulae]|uniref:PEP-CTERM sorting domain-containing protein n=1 Tax=Aquisphaera insulae TaxID=2712864 RepID=UPI0013EBA9EF|nr:PEP-CTERM sorting domain-containing protein [Aquisphaera insulae]